MRHRMGDAMVVDTDNATATRQSVDARSPLPIPTWPLLCRAIESVGRNERQCRMGQ